MFTGDTNENTVLPLETQIAAELARVAVMKMIKRVWMGHPAATPALGEAVSLLMKVCSVAEALELNSEQLLQEASNSSCAAGLADLLKDLQMLHYKTNDIVCVKADRSLQVSGLPPITLGKRAFMVLRILGRHALAHPAAFMNIADLLNAVLEELGCYANEKGTSFWPDPVPEDIHKIVNILREEVRKAGGNPLLIESSPSYGGGYRLSTPHYNIIVQEDLDYE